jgi:hypothetical protein
MSSASGTLHGHGIHIIKLDNQVKKACLLPPPGGYVITGFVCVYVCLSVSTITHKIPNIFIRNFLNAFPIGQGRTD